MNIIEYLKVRENRDTISENLVHGVSWGASAYIDFNLFQALFLDGIGKIIGGGFGIIFTSLKVVMLKKYKKKVEKLRSDLDKKELIKSTFGLLLVYLIFAFVSFVGSIGFVLGNVKAQERSDIQKLEIVDPNKALIDFYNNKIKQDNNQITQNLTSIVTVEENYKKNTKNDTYATKIYNDRKSEYELKIKDLQTSVLESTLKLQELQKSDLKVIEEEVKATDIFETLAKAIPWSNLDAIAVQVLIGILFGLSIELALYYTTEIDSKVKVQESRNNMLVYINALFSSGSPRLMPDSKIAYKTGLSKGECKRLRNILYNTEKNGIPVIQTFPGGTKANFKKEEILHIIEENLKLK